MNDNVLQSFDDIFGSPELVSSNDVKELPLNRLLPFRDHPFKVLQNEDFERLISSIHENGVLIPAIVRQRGDNYELISGHRRKAACEKLGMRSMPVLIREMTDEEAVIAMVDSNVQRENILPSEKAFAYKMKLEALNRQGQRQNSTSTQVVSKLRTNEKVGLENGESREQVRRYIRLTELIPSLLDMVDDRTIPFTIAVELSYVSAENQEVVETEIVEYGANLTAVNVSKLKKAEQAGLLNSTEVRRILTIKKNDNPKQVKISSVIVKKYNLPDNAAEREKIIDKALQVYFATQDN